MNQEEILKKLENAPDFDENAADELLRGFRQTICEKMKKNPEVKAIYLFPQPAGNGGISLLADTDFGDDYDSIKKEKQVYDFLDKLFGRAYTEFVDYLMEEGNPLLPLIEAGEFCALYRR